MVLPETDVEYEQKSWTMCSVLQMSPLALLENSDNDMALNLIAINKLRLPDV